MRHPDPWRCRCPVARPCGGAGRRRGRPPRRVMGSGRAVSLRRPAWAGRKTGRVVWAAVRRMRPDAGVFETFVDGVLGATGGPGGGPVRNGAPGAAAQHRTGTLPSDRYGHSPVGRAADVVAPCAEASVGVIGRCQGGPADDLENCVRGRSVRGAFTVRPKQAHSVFPGPSHLPQGNCRCWWHDGRQRSSIRRISSAGRRPSATSRPAVRVRGPGRDAAAVVVSRIVSSPRLIRPLGGVADGVPAEDVGDSVGLEPEVLDRALSLGGVPRGPL